MFACVQSDNKMVSKSCAMWTVFSAAVIVGVWQVADAAPAITRAKGRQSTLNQLDAMSFLHKYGYLKGGEDETMGHMLSGESLQDALKTYQAFSGIPVTGKLDEATMKLMKTPRCGVKDIEEDSNNKEREKRYVHQGSWWDQSVLTWSVGKYPSRRLTEHQVDKELETALKLWEQNSALRFHHIDDDYKASIKVRFETGEHSLNPADPAFDGRGDSLAHAYYPQFGGDVHFDDDELWTAGEYRGSNLMQVAAHEFGHSLGLKHSSEPDAVMAPTYQGYDPDFDLHPDDIDGIQALYGMPYQNKNGLQQSTSYEESDEVDAPSLPVAPTPSPNKLCADASFDTIFTNAEGHIYIFKGDEYYKLTERNSELTLETGYPRLISEGWPGLPGGLDAAFTISGGKSYFFKGQLYWRFDGRVMDEGFPRRIADGLAGVPDDVDAAFFWTNGKVYFFKGDEYWLYDPRASPPVDWTYPRPLALWDGLPDRIDAALVHEGYTYFFKGQRYYRFDDLAFKVDSGNPPFPRSTAGWWFGCGRPVETKDDTDD